MHTVIQTTAFLTSAREEGVTDGERERIVQHLAGNPQSGHLMRGTGGARKLRFRGKGKGKSGGYRVITCYAADDLPVFILDVFGKGSKTNLSKAERNELKSILGQIADAYRKSAKARAINPACQNEEDDTMSKNRILDGAREALAIAKGEADPETYVITVPQAIDVRAVRKRTGLSQAKFAKQYGFTAARIRDWEQGRSSPDGAVRAYLTVIEKDPDAVRRALAAA